MKISETLKKKILLGLLAGVPAIASGLISNCQARYEARQEAASAERDAKKQSLIESNSVIEGYKPAMAEIHEILTAGQLWAEDINTKHDKMMQLVTTMRADVAYCKAYVGFDSRGRYEYEAILDEPDMMYEAPPPPPKPVAKLPSNVQQAQQYMKARKEMECDPRDPLCGDFGLE